MILPEGHRLAGARGSRCSDIAGEPLIGVDAGDPYGEITARPFADAGLPRRLSVKARFAQTVVSLVRHGLGVAIIDEFSVAGTAHARPRARAARRDGPGLALRGAEGRPRR